MEDDQLVLLDFGNPVVKEENVKPEIPCALILFKQIQNETQALKQIKDKHNQNNVYDKIRRTLEKKLGLGRIYRGISVNQQIKIKQMIQTCRQRKHIRSGNLSDFKKVDPTRRRNFSAKQKRNQSQESRILVPERPLTGRPRTSRLKSSKINYNKFQYEVIEQKFLKLSQRQNEVLGNKNLRKHPHNRQYSQLSKQNKNPNIKIQPQISKKNTSNNFQSNKMDQCSDQSNYQRRKHHKNIQLQTKFKNIIQKCDNEKEDMVCIGRKIGYFQYFCHKMADKKSNIQKFCKKTDEIRSTFDDGFS